MFLQFFTKRGVFPKATTRVGAGHRWFGALLVLAVLMQLAVGCTSGAESCSDSSCNVGERCVQEECRKSCDDNASCPQGQSCALWDFGDGTQAKHCVALGNCAGQPCKSDETCRNDVCVPGPKACRDAKDCDTARGFSCVDGTCRVRCNSHFDCARVGLCEPAADGTYCSYSGAAVAGEYHTRCPQGDECAAGFLCLGAGTGDLDAYCSASCQQDQDCPAGYQCGTAGATPCEDACGVQGVNGAGCVPSDDIGAGRTYACNEPYGVIRQVCRQRNFCSSCERDEDCLAVPGQICAQDRGGAKICTTPCDNSQRACPWGNASECGNWDKGRGIATCSHRFGKCQGTGQGCEPCARDADCGKSGLCVQAGFTGEQFCIDLSVECDCGKDAEPDGTCSGHGCPDSQGGVSMICFSGSRFEGDPLSHRCIGATSNDVFSGSQQSGCWLP